MTILMSSVRWPSFTIPDILPPRLARHGEQVFLRVLVQMLTIVRLTLLIVRWSLSGPIARAAQWLKPCAHSADTARRELPQLDLFQPLARELATIAESLDHARSAAEREARLRQTGEAIWTAQSLEVQVHNKLGDSPLFVVSNREPYLHKHDRQEHHRGRSGQWRW